MSNFLNESEAHITKSKIVTIKSRLYSTEKNKMSCCSILAVSLAWDGHPPQIIESELILDL